MDEQPYIVYYNAVRTKYATYLFAFGWIYQEGWTPLLKKVEGLNNFQFKLKELEGNVGLAVITPFAIAEEIPDNPRSIQVTDVYNSYQIQVNDIDAVGSGENTPGKWVASKNNK